MVFHWTDSADVTYEWNIGIDVQRVAELEPRFMVCLEVIRVNAVRYDPLQLAMNAELVGLIETVDGIGNQSFWRFQSGQPL